MQWERTCILGLDHGLPEKGENPIAAGRCLGAEYEALASARVTVQCFGYGRAAGEELRSLPDKDGARLSERGPARQRPGPPFSVKI